VRIHKRFGREITVNYYPNRPARECTLKRGTPADYKALSHFHYRSSRLPPPRKIFKLKRKDELYGVIVYSYPPPTIFRRKALKGSLSQL
jgi:hypothetical protein